jgi:hypothetical protein
MTIACVDASTVMVAEAAKVTMSDLITPEHKRTNNTLGATLATKKVCIGLANLEKTVVIGNNRGEKEELAFTSFLRDNAAYSHGPHQICQVFQGSWLSTCWM